MLFFVRIKLLLGFLTADRNYTHLKLLKLFRPLVHHSGDFARTIDNKAYSNKQTCT